MCSSHLTELARTLPAEVGRDEAVRYCCFTGEVEGGRFRFAYALELGGRSSAPVNPRGIAARRVSLEYYFVQ